MGFQNGSRVVTTLFIWIMIAVIMLATLADSHTFQEDWVIPVMGLLSIGGGVLATGFIWGWGANRSPAEEAEKSKRRSRIERFLDTMDERELDELRSRLMSEQDGELATLDDVLREHRRSK
jgi:hypothetical protein